MTKFAEVTCIGAALAIACLLIPGSIAYSNDTLFQTSTMSALMQGVFDGSTTFKDLKAYGDFGLGTVQSLDGEMIELDGRFYQVKSDGVAYRLNDSTKTPFAEVTFFRTDETVVSNGTSNLTQLDGYLDSKLDTKNIFYAIRIDGTFDYVKTRSVPIQSKPYPTLSEAQRSEDIRVPQCHGDNSRIQVSGLCQRRGRPGVSHALLDSKQVGRRPLAGLQAEECQHQG